MSVPEPDDDMILLSNAETIILPAQALPAPAQAAVPRPRAGEGGQARPGPAARHGRSRRRRTMISRLSLLVILAVQAALTLRLRNTAFEDEALYLYAGRLEIEHLLHGAGLQGLYVPDFSGSPVLYPVVAAALNAVGGLALARALSLAEMLAVTAMLYAISRFLFNERAALIAAALYAVTAPVLFVGNLATYDATCLFLLAAATTIVVRTSALRRPVFMLAAPLAALAVAVKYAGALFLPTICVLLAVAAWPRLGRRALWRPAWFCAAVVVLIEIGLRAGGSAYISGIAATTTERAQGSTPIPTIVTESAAWGGGIAVLAIVGAVAYACRARIEAGESTVKAGGWRRRALLGTVLAGTVFLAPLYQMHLHTDVSLQKHIGFGMFFAAPMAGVGVARIVGDHFRRPQMGIAVWCTALALGLGQSWVLFHAWPSSGPLVSAFSRYLEPGANYLVEVPEVPTYYLEGKPDGQPGQFWSTFALTYNEKNGHTVWGPAGFAAAVEQGAFRTIALSGTVTPAADAVIERAIASSGLYRLAAVVPLRDSYGPLTYRIWVRRSAPARPARGAKGTLSRV